MIADTQDNPGAGGSGDTTGLLEALVRNDAQQAVLGIFFDAEPRRLRIGPARAPGSKSRWAAGSGPKA